MDRFVGHFCYSMRTHQNHSGDQNSALDAMAKHLSLNYVIALRRPSSNEIFHSFG